MFLQIKQSMEANQSTVELQTMSNRIAQMLAQFPQTTFEDLKALYIDLRRCDTLQHCPEKSAALADLLDGIVEKLHGPVALRGWRIFAAEELSRK